MLARANRLFDIIMIARVEIDADNFTTWHHDVVDGYIFQLQNTDQHLSVTAGDTVSSLVDDRPQFFAGQRLQRGFVSPNSEQKQQPVGHDID